MKIPKKQSDIKLKTYLKYVDFIKDLKDEEKTDMNLLKNTILIFYDIEEAKFNEMPYTQISDMYKIIENILHTPQELVPMFNINDIEYAINPNFDDMTLAELVDCDTEDVVQQMSVLFRQIESKKGDKYKIVKYDSDKIDIDLFKENLTLDIYNGFIFFFLSLTKDLLKDSQNSIMEMDLTVEQKKNLQSLGDGLDGFMNYALET